MAAHKDWTPSTLGSDTDMLTGYPFKSSNYVADFAGVKLLRGDNVVQGTLRWDGVKRWPENEITGLEQYLLHAGDVVLAMDRPWIEAGLKYAAISTHDIPCILVQRVARLRGGQNLNTGYLRYLIGSRAFTEHVLALQTGTAVPHISGSQIKAFKYLRPPLREQQAIACILGALDDKIELNRRQNRTLEAITRAIFQSWFVDLDPVRAKAAGRKPNGLSNELAALFSNSFEDSHFGAIPKGWRVGVLADLAEIVMGSSPPGSSYNDEGVGTPLVNGPVEFGTYFAEKRKWTTQVTKLSEPNDLIFCVRGSTTGRRVVADDVYCLGRGVCAIRAKDKVWAFVHELVNSELARLLARVTGSVFPNLNGPDFKQFSITIPPSPLLRAYQSIAEPMLGKIATNFKESRTLAELRDAILPKLVSGELRVLDAERIVGRAL